MAMRIFIGWSAFAILVILVVLGVAVVARLLS